MSADEAPVTGSAVHRKLIDVLTFTSFDLATSKDGMNWCSTAFFAALDADPFRLTLVLESGGRTLDQLRANPNVGVKVVPAGLLNPFAQGVGTATIRDQQGRDETFRALLSKEPQIEPFLATPIEALIIDVDWWRVTHVAEGLLPGQVLHRTAVH